MWNNGTRGTVEIAIQHEALAKCCIANQDHIPSTISSRTAVPSVLELICHLWRIKRKEGDCHLRSNSHWKQGKCSRFASPTKPDASMKAAQGIVPINTKQSTVAVFVMWLEKCAIFMTWLQKCFILWLPQVCYISHVTGKKKRAFTANIEWGGAFDPPTQNTVFHHETLI